MASVFGHALAAVAVSRAAGRGSAGLFSWPVSLAAIIVAAAPDLDIFVWMWLKPENMTPHRGFTHSLVFALATATLAWLVLSRGARRGGWKLALAMYLAALSHPLLDYLMGRGPGVPLFWPFLEQDFLSPIQLVPTAYYSKTLPGFIRIITSFERIKGALLELVILLPILAAQWKSRPGARLQWWAPALLISALGEAMVYLIYN